ncbi:DNA-3-methyladenine glycosylase family protein [Paenibacillus hexagrammi]|uniref:DNA-3-methyladenine glycosylase II n=1 Tax=Paenibacillus hexagrammi TaxID=2908839 RepID=A0ABY3SKI2_9BACL|nr:DNA-3-methyladenine glycosylase [Paenibacillus sp. YPD9-1]UJF33492.1 DNA-3-methyladenine glycosylase [Paenibacillus sp. YPD9-1]
MSKTTIHLNYQHPAIEMLCNADPKLRMLIRLVGELSLTYGDDPFRSLAMSILSQQLSAKAAATIQARVLELIPEFTPEQLLAADPELLRSCGVSRPKIRYIQDLSQKSLSGELNFSDLDIKNDAEWIKELTTIKGVGTWTAEMFLIFNLGRPNVLSLGDAGLQRAARWLHQIDERPDGNYLGQAGASWSPYRSYASLYLWRAIDLGFVDSGHDVEGCLDKQNAVMEEDVENG